MKKETKRSLIVCSVLAGIGLLFGLVVWILVQCGYNVFIGTFFNFDLIVVAFGIVIMSFALFLFCLLLFQVRVVWGKIIGIIADILFACVLGYACFVGYALLHFWEISDQATLKAPGGHDILFYSRAIGFDEVSFDVTVFERVAPFVYRQIAVWENAAPVREDWTTNGYTVEYQSDGMLVTYSDSESTWEKFCPWLS